jgi:hypothetical protein
MGNVQLTFKNPSALLLQVRDNSALKKSKHALMDLLWVENLPVARSSPVPGRLLDALLMQRSVLMDPVWAVFLLAASLLLAQQAAEKVARKS